MNDRLVSYPYVVVRIGCELCQRRGQYRPARLAHKFGPEIDMQDLLVRLTADCAGRDKHPYRQVCAARFIDLDPPRRAARRARDDLANRRQQVTSSGRSLSSRAMSAIQQMHDIEVNGGLAWPEEGRILAYLGCPLDPPPRTRMFGEVLVGRFAEAEAWLRERARDDYGVTFKPPRRNLLPPLVQRLYEADIPGSVYWVYDGAFSVSLRDDEAGVTSWAEAEAWLAKHSDRRIT